MSRVQEDGRQICLAAPTTTTPLPLKPMKTYAVTMTWNIRPIDPQENSEETTVLLIVAENEEKAIEQALASCAQEDEPDDAFAIQYDEVSYKRYGKQRNGEYGECGLVAAY